MDYSGFGGQVNFRINPKVELFVASGYNLDGAGFNAGGQVRLAPTKLFILLSRPCLLVSLLVAGYLCVQT
jgi:hypothetical protein